MVGNLRNTGTPYGKRDTTWQGTVLSGGAKKKKKKRKSKKGKVLSRGRTGYFPGCTIQARTPELAARTVKLMRLCGEDVMPVPELCCGSPFINAGLTGEWEDNARTVMKFFRDNRIRNLVVNCPGCARSFKEDYPGILGDELDRTFPGIVLLSDILERNLKKLPVRAMNGRAIYHDPCHLGRTLGITETPRTLIRATGMKLVEFHAHGRLSECCGGGDLLLVFRKEESKRTLEKRTREAVAKDVDYLISACGHCEARFRDYVEEHPDCGFEVLDIVDLFDVGDDRSGQEGGQAGDR